MLVTYIVTLLVPSMQYAIKWEGGELMKSKKPAPQGRANIYFETNFKKSPVFNENELTPLQAQVFSQLSIIEQDKIREGYGVVIVDLKDDKQICSFNMENYRPPDSAIESFARRLLPMIQEYYSKEENIRDFEAHVAKQGKSKANKNGEK